MTETLYTPAEVARYLKVHTSTVVRWCREGTLEAVRVGRSWRISQEALGRFMAEQQRKEGTTDKMGGAII